MSANVTQGLPFGGQLVLYDEHKTSELLKVSKRWLQTARQSGTGPNYVKIGRLVRYRSQDLENWISAQTRSSTCNVININSKR